MALDKQSDTLHHAGVAKLDAHPGHYLRAWRLASGLTLEQASERIERLSESRANADPSTRSMHMTHATLSRVERGKIPYGQGLLEILAEVYKTDRASLIMRDPSEPEGLWSIWEQLKPTERVQAVEVIKALRRSGARG